MKLNDDGVPLPDPELMKKWREAALRDLPTPQDLANLITAMRWASELDRIGGPGLWKSKPIAPLAYILSM